MKLHVGGADPPFHYGGTAEAEDWQHTPGLSESPQRYAVSIVDRLLV